MSTFELRPWNSDRTDPSRHDLPWADTRTGGALNSDLDPWLTSFRTVAPVALDLARIATAAFAADQLNARGQAFSREMDILVHVGEPDAWTGDILDELADLIAPLTGDLWQISVTPETSPARLVPAPLELGEVERRSDRVALLSGGLDSFAGAVISSASGDVAYLGHWDNSAVKHAQDCVVRWFADAGRLIDYTQVLQSIWTEKPAGAQRRRKKPESTTRSRSLLFMALATALASARGARIVEVPENGFTSLNPPLGPERGGAFTTRSTHPVTLARYNHVLERIGLDIRVENPYAWCTKGELVEAAAAVTPADLADGAARTISCAKLNGNYYKGGDPNAQCGLCVACLTRRASLVRAGVDDRSVYLFQRLADGRVARSPEDQRRVAEGLAKLQRNRANDVEAVQMAIASGIDDLDLMAIGPYPDDFDMDAAVELCRRGLEELSRVRLA